MTEDMRGHNNPPEPTPFEISKQEIEDLYTEAKEWLDGKPVASQIEADALNTLKDAVKKASAKAEANYKAEVKPHQDTVKEIQERYNTLIGSNKSVTGLAVKAEEAVNAALKPYLLELDRQQQEAARVAREAAEKAQAEALEAMRKRDGANLAENEAAEALVSQAKAAETAAKQAEKARPLAKGTGRATGLRTVWKAIMEDEVEAARWVWGHCRPELIAFIQEQADKAVRSGARKIHGFHVKEDKVL